MANPDRSLMTRSRQEPQLLMPIVSSVVIGTVLTVYPLPLSLAQWRPDFLLLLMVYWVLVQPNWCGIWFAFAIGLIADLLMDSLLGQYALDFVLVAFGVRFMTRHRRILPFAHLTVTMAGALAGHLLIQFCLRKILGQSVGLYFWLTFLPSMLVWPMVYGALYRWRS